MIFLCFIVLGYAFYGGFRPLAGFDFIIIYLLLVIASVILIYFLTLIVSRLMIKKWAYSKWANILSILIILCVVITPVMNYFGEEFAYFYAGYDNIRQSADKLMSATKEGNATEIECKSYPESFKKLGASRVFVCKSYVIIWRGGLASKKHGLVIYADENIAPPYKHGYDQYKISDRIYSFALYY